MGDEPRYFEQAADVLGRAMKAASLGEQALLLEEALRLNRLALAAERDKLGKLEAASPSSRAPDDSGL